MTWLYVLLVLAGVGVAIYLGLNASKTAAQATNVPMDKRGAVVANVPGNPPPLPAPPLPPPSSPVNPGAASATSAGSLLRLVR